MDAGSAFNQLRVTAGYYFAVSGLIKTGEIDCLIVGSDHIIINGDFVNKIGICSHAVLAKYHVVKVMVVVSN